jgi:hypothetical protein
MTLSFREALDEHLSALQARDEVRLRREHDTPARRHGLSAARPG